MARMIANGIMNLPNQGSNLISEYVKHFESAVSFEDLQTQTNAYLALLGSPVFVNRPSIRDITFEVHETGQPMPLIMYYAQIHFVLVGDGDDSANI